MEKYKILWRTSFPILAKKTSPSIFEGRTTQEQAERDSIRESGAKPLIVGGGFVSWTEWEWDVAQPVIGDDLRGYFSRRGLETNTGGDLLAKAA